MEDVRQVEDFQAQNADGTHQTGIFIYQHIIRIGNQADPSAEALGLREVRTVDGYACNRIDDDTYEVVGDPWRSGTIVRRCR